MLWGKESLLAQLSKVCPIFVHQSGKKDQGKHMATAPSKIFYLSAALFIISVVSSSAFAIHSTLFGPKTIKIKWYCFHLSHHRFRVKEPGSGVVTITKNTPEKRIWKGLIRINGKIIPLREFLRSNDLALEREVMLRSRNRIFVCLLGARGASIRIVVAKKETTPPPLVNISANPPSIKAGESSVLTWTSTHADTCSIEPNIGSVALNGSRTVSPEESTTFTITASGAGGSTSANVTVTVLYPPTVEISADPETIFLGQPCTLSWNSIHSNSCVIDSGIGSVDVSGFITISPSETTTYTITASGLGGNATDSVTVSVLQPSITITLPRDGDVVSRTDVGVEGTLTNIGSHDVGVTVNDVVAMVDGTRFIANHVPLEEGENIVIATMTDKNGRTTATSITLFAEAAANNVILIADPESGVSPCYITLRIESPFTLQGEPSLSYTGPAEVEILDSATDNEYNAHITTEGIYYFTVQARDELYLIHTDTVAVQVLSEEALDALLKEKWDRMKGALAAGDHEKALSYHHPAFRDRYEALYSLLGNKISSLAQETQNIELIFAEGDRAKYRVNRDHEIDGQIVTITYYVYFSRDENGLWKIERY